MSPRYKVRAADVTVRRTVPAGYLALSATVDGHLVRCSFMGYTRRDAVRIFQQEVSR